MKKCKDNYLALLLVLIGCAAGNANSSWEEFFAQPGKNSYSELINTIEIERCGWGNPDNLDVVPMQIRRQLFDLIAAGNEFAFKAGLLVSRCLDGGELEDFHRSAGLFFDAQPHTFLSILIERKAVESDIKFMLTNLPLDTVDNIARKILLIQSRISLLNSVDDISVVEVKRLALSVLEKEQQNLNRIKMEMNNAR